MVRPIQRRLRCLNRVPSGAARDDFKAVIMAGLSEKRGAQKSYCLALAASRCSARNGHQAYFYNALSVCADGLSFEALIANSTLFFPRFFAM